MANSSQVYELAMDRRHIYAAEIFDPGKVSEQITERAATGFRSLRIYQDMPFDLQTTKAARKLEDWLDKSGYRYSWQDACEPADIFRPGSGIVFTELLINW